MSKTDWAIVTLNAFTLIVATLGLTDPRGGAYDGMSIALMLTIATVMVNGGWIIRRGSQDQRQPVKGQEATGDVTLDARHLLEIDERLEMLERRDAQRVRELAARGEIHGPYAPLADPVERTAIPRERA